MMQLPFLPVAAAAALALSACGDRGIENVEAGPPAANDAAAGQEPEAEAEPAEPEAAATAPAEEAVAPVPPARPDRERRPPPPPPRPAPKAEEPVVDPHAGHDMNDMDHD